MSPSITYVPVAPKKRTDHYTSKVHHHLAEQIETTIYGPNGRTIRLLGFISRKALGVWTLHSNDCSLTQVACSVPQDIEKKLKQDTFVLLEGTIEVKAPKGKPLAGKKIIKVTNVEKRSFVDFVKNNFNSPLPSDTNVANMFQKEILGGMLPEDLAEVLMHMAIGSPPLCENGLNKTGGLFASVFPETPSEVTRVKGLCKALRVLSPDPTKVIGTAIKPRRVIPTFSSEYLHIIADFTTDNLTKEKARFMNFIGLKKPLNTYYQASNISSLLPQKVFSEEGLGQSTIAPNTEFPFVTERISTFTQKELMHNYDPSFLGMVDYHRVYVPSYSEKDLEYASNKLNSILEKEALPLEAMGKNALFDVNRSGRPTDILQIARSLARVDKKEQIEKRHIDRAATLSANLYDTFYSSISTEAFVRGVSKRARRILTFLDRNTEATRNRILSAFSSYPQYEIDSIIERLQGQGIIYEGMNGKYRIIYK